jgi:plastocyanin
MFERNGSTRSLITSVLVLGVAACGGGDGTEQQTEAPSGETEAAAPVAVENPATIAGVINFTGTPPANDPIDMSEEQACAEKHSETPTRQTVVVNDGKLKNVFVRITEGLTGATGGTPTEPVVVDQDGCVYIPHVVGVVAGQGVVFKNSDGLLHNVKATPSNNRPFNISQPGDMSSPAQTFNAAEVMIPVECNVHGWMQSYIGVVEHPYFAVSGDDGSFTIANLPAGTYTLETWHEQYGTQTQQITVGPNETAEVTFDYDASMAGAHVPLGTPFDPHGDHAADSRVASATH